MNTLQTMRKKLKNKKGFTLMEMLIVVAIVAILVAIAVPTFNGALDKARKATDEANIRAAQGLATTAYMSKDEPEAVTQNVVDSKGQDYKMKSSGEYVSGGKTYTYTKGAQLTVKVSADGDVAIEGGTEKS